MELGNLGKRRFKKAEGHLEAVLDGSQEPMEGIKSALDEIRKSSPELRQMVDEAIRSNGVDPDELFKGD